MACARDVDLAESEDQLHLKEASSGFTIIDTTTVASYNRELAGPGRRYAP